MPIEISELGAPNCPAAAAANASDGMLSSDSKKLASVSTPISGKGCGAYADAEVEAMGGWGRGRGKSWDVVARGEWLG